LFSAARAHSKLRQTALEALHEIALRVTNQRQLDGMLLYLEQYGQHVDSLRLIYKYSVLQPPQLRQLPDSLQLDNLHIWGLTVQQRPGNGYRGVLQAPLQQLRMENVVLLDKDELSLPPGSRLQVLSLGPRSRRPALSVEQLQQHQQLTFLELGNPLKLDGKESVSLQFLGALTMLVHLHIRAYPGMDSFTLPAGVLAGRTQLHHLELAGCELAAGVLSDLKHM
jgi:hypothetical protein